MLDGILIGLAVLIFALVRWGAWAAARQERSRTAARQERSIGAPGPIRPVSPTPQCAARRSNPGARRRRVAIRPLRPTARHRYTGAWRGAEANFARAPGAAVRQLDALAANVMRERGYPVETFEHDVGDILPVAPEVVEDYRAAHVVALANDIASDRDRRLAMVHYHALLKGLLDDSGDDHQEHLRPQPLPAETRRRGPAPATTSLCSADACLVDRCL
jgi:hypothetical protein